MRFSLILVLLTVLVAPALLAEDADEVRERGIAALKESQTNPHAIVDAARLFIKAGELYSASGDEEKNVEMNSFLYWCKKKMTLEDIEAFTKGGEAAVITKLAAIEKAAPKVDEAQKWFDRAGQFAAKYPDEHLLIAVRFFEVADRFKGSDAALQAMDRSLKEMLSEKSGAVKTVAPPAAIKPADTAPADVGKRPIPLADALKAAENLVKDLLKDDFAKTDAAGRLALAAKLLQQADENKNDAAAEYVCLHEARDAAVLAGDSAKALEIQTRLREAFKTDFAALLLDLKKLESSAKTADTASALATLLARESESALAAGDYDAAVRFNARAEDLLPLSKDTALKTRLKTEIPRVQAIKKESVAALAAQKTLTTKPEDPEANLAAGKFALLLGDVEKAMALLAKSKDATLSALAKQELSPPQDATAQTALADGWFDSAQKERSLYMKARMQERAALWYTSALPGLTGFAKLKIETRIKSLSIPAHPETAAPNVAHIDTLKTTPNSTALSNVAIGTGISDEIKRFAAARAALPADQQLKVTLAKLKELNGGKDVREKHVIANGQITELDLMNNEQLESIDPLFGLPLKSLNLWHCDQIKNLNALRGMKLTTFCPLGLQKLPSLNGLEGMPLKGAITLRDCILFKSLRPLKGSKLTSLDLWYCRDLENLEGLEGMPVTDVILFANFELTSIAGLAGLPIKRMEISEAPKLKSLEGIERLPLVEFSCKKMKSLKPAEYDRLLRISTLEKLTTDDPARDQKMLEAIKAHRKQ